MGLEATIICIDNSEYMRNGDYLPSRSEAQQDAVNLIAAAKTQSNPESSVAVMTAGGKNPEVLVTLTQDLGKILSALHSVRLQYDINFVAALQVAQLALKHRQNKHQHQRIIAFVGTPIKENSDELVRFAKRLKKNNIAVDVVNFGEETTNTERLEAFINAVNANDNSHLVTVPPGPHILSDILLSSPIVVGEGGGGAFGAAAAASAAAAAAAAHGGMGGEFDFGVDPTLDPELAMALRLSMEEERARQEQTRRPEPAAASNVPEPVTSPSDDVEMADDDQLHQAIKMSMAAEEAARGAAAAPSTAPVTTSSPAPTPSTGTLPAPTTMDLSDDPDMEAALALSMGTQSTSSEAAATDLQSQDFLQSVLGSLPGVDPNDPRIRSVLEGMKGTKEEERKKDGHK